MNPKFKRLYADYAEVVYIGGLGRGEPYVATVFAHQEDTDRYFIERVGGHEAFWTGAETIKPKEPVLIIDEPALKFAKDDRVRTSLVDENGTHYAGTVLSSVWHGLVDVKLDRDGEVRRCADTTLTLLYSPSAAEDVTPHPMQAILDMIDIERAKHIKSIELAQISLAELKKAKKLIYEAGR